MFRYPGTVTVLQVVPLQVGYRCRCFHAAVSRALTGPQVPLFVLQLLCANTSGLICHQSAEPAVLPPGPAPPAAGRARALLCITVLILPARAACAINPALPRYVPARGLLALEVLWASRGIQNTKKVKGFSIRPPACAS
ncbi:hypothetical protein NDU88_005408 [Pleurodeles waltl]|uniref:Uncharacterized protein n=1 Tax=Pleurodeles waltl TaxID=8319 RepID=A0AAV7L158_PLEWA|nr:hypothetical protein NDU88_005408 [Pleurodeles waltl]